MVVGVSEPAGWRTFLRNHAEAIAGSPGFFRLQSASPDGRRTSNVFWLAYRQEDTRCVMIVRAGFLIAARLRAGLLVDGIDDQFVEGHELPANVAKKVPERMVSDCCPADEARELLEAIER